MKTAFFTGHRHIGFTTPNILGVNKLINYALDKGVTEFYNGMAIGADMLAAKICSDRQLKWTAVLPCLDQTDKWNKLQKESYYKLLEKASSITIISQEYYEGCMHKRNLHMINNSDLCLAIYNESLKGGTAFTVKNAIKKGLPIIKFNPNNRNILWIIPEKKEPQLRQLEFSLVY
jgi:uncharacterized phage-like protein YoqJ